MRSNGLILAATDESQADTCLRKGLNPLNMGDVAFQWNATTFSAVVVDVLNNTLLNSNEEYGANGCCAPGLWCSNDGCFT